MLHFATLVNAYLKNHYHILTQISQSWAKHAFYIIFSIMLAIFTYYAGIVLNAFTILLYSKLCWHNRLRPTTAVCLLMVALTRLRLPTHLRHPLIHAICDTTVAVKNVAQKPAVLAN